MARSGRETKAFYLGGVALMVAALIGTGWTMWHARTPSPPAGRAPMAPPAHQAPAASGGAAAPHLAIPSASLHVSPSSQSSALPAPRAGIPLGTTAGGPAASLPRTIRATNPDETRRSGTLHITPEHVTPPPQTFEVGPVPPKASVRVGCVTCPGNVLDVNF